MSRPQTVPRRVAGRAAGRARRGRAARRPARPPRARRRVPGARLREALERERHELEAIVDGATDLILQVDGDRTGRPAQPGRRAAARDDGGGGRRPVVRRRPRAARSPGATATRACPLAEVRSTRRADRLSRDRRSVAPTGIRCGSPAATRRRTAAGGDAPGRPRSCATSARSGRSRSSAKASWRPSATSCGRRSR